MNKISIGRTRKKSKEENCTGGAGYSRAADALFVFGAAAVCVMLTLPLLPASAERTFPEDTAAVAVMSDAVQSGNADPQEREELAAPSGFGAEEEEWSFYDYIGELFAGLISGQR